MLVTATNRIPGVITDDSERGNLCIPYDGKLLVLFCRVFMDQIIKNISKMNKGLSSKKLDRFATVL